MKQAIIELCDLYRERLRAFEHAQDRISDTEFNGAYEKMVGVYRAAIEDYVMRLDEAKRLAVLTLMMLNLIEDGHSLEPDDIPFQMMKNAIFRILGRR